MGVVLKASAVLAATFPVVMQTRQPIFVEGDGPQRAVPATRHPFMVNEQDRIQQDGQQQPPGGEPVRAEGEHQEQNAGQKDDHTRIAGEPFLPGKLDGTATSLFQSPRVFLCRRRGECSGRLLHGGFHNFSRSTSADHESFRTPYRKSPASAAPYRSKVGQASRRSYSIRKSIRCHLCQERARHLLSRLAEDLPRRSGFGNAALVHDVNGVGHAASEAHGVRYHDHRLTLTGEIGNDLKYLAGHARIERAGRLVKEDGFRFHGQRRAMATRCC